MSYAVPSYLDYTAPASAEIAPQTLKFVQRSRLQWVPLLVPSTIAMVSWFSGGLPQLTDLAFVLYTALMGIYLVMEFYRFPRRFGIGGLVLWGGSLTWFCEDYFIHWFHKDFNLGDTIIPIPAEVVAKAACLLMFFTALMSIGLGIRRGKWVEKLLLLVPEVDNSNFYLLIVFIMLAIGLSPYYLLNAEPWYICIWHAATSNWTQGPALTAYRTGNLNYSWSGYAAQLIQAGQVGGIFAIVYAILLAKHTWERVVTGMIWFFWMAVAFQTDRRGEVAFEFMPAIALLFIKFQSQAAVMFRKNITQAYIYCGLLTFVLYAAVQWQGNFRGGGIGTGSFEKLDLGRNQGNTMFSEGLRGYMLIGDTKPVFFDDFPGEGGLLAIPRTVYMFLIGPVPRALWTTKPIDPAWQWYNSVITGSNGLTGTTISHGLTGSWYFSYGILGMIEGAILVGWLMGISERALQHSDGKPISIMMCLGFAVWLFRTYRDFIFIDLYALMVGGLALTILTLALRPFFTPKTVS